MSTTVHTADGREGRIIESDNVRGKITHRVAGIGFDKWYPEHQVHTASEEDGWMPIPDDREQSDVFSDPGFPEEEFDAHPDPDHGREDMMFDQGGDDFGNELDALSEFAATGEITPEAQQEFAGSPDPETILGYRLGGPGDHVDHDNSVALPWNPDPQHDATVPAADASWGPGEYTIDADDRLHPSDSLSFNDVSNSEAGPLPGPAPHLFAKRGIDADAFTADLDGWIDYPEEGPREPNLFDKGMNWARSLNDDDRKPRHRAAARGQTCDYCGKDGHSWETHPEAHADVAAWKREESQLEEPFGKHVESSIPNLGGKYVDIGYGIHTGAHHNSPVQMFRDDPHAFIDRRGFARMGSSTDPAMDRLAYLLDAEAERVGGLQHTAAWRDVSAKAKRLRAQGKVAIKDIGPDRIYATVTGDNGVYETLITKGSSLGGFDAYGANGSQQVGNWHCSCNWGDWAFKRRFTFIGRLCSHGLASYWEMQAKHQAEAANESGQDPRRNRVKTKRRAEVIHDYDRPMSRDRGLGELFDHYGPEDDVSRQDDFDRRTRATEDYAARTDLPGEEDDVELGLGGRHRRDSARTPWTNDPDVYDPADDPESSHYDPYGSGVGEDDPRRSYEMMGKDGPKRFPKRADLLRTTPRSMTPSLNFIDRTDYDTKTVDVTSLDDIDEVFASDEGQIPEDGASVEEREAARHLGRRMVAMLAEEILPDFEEWYAQNYGRQLDQARPSEAGEAIADYSQERGLDQATSEMLQEFVAKNFTAEDTQPGADAEPEIKHFEMAAGRYLMAAVTRTADLSDFLDPGDFNKNEREWLDNGGRLDQPIVKGPQDSGGGAAAAPAAPTSTPSAVADSAPLNVGPSGTGKAPASDLFGPSDPGTGKAAPAQHMPAGTGSGGSGGPTSVTVNPGDTLSGIAEKNGLGGDWKGLYDTNKSTVGGDPNLIMPGQTLTLPGGGGSGGTPATGQGKGPAPGPTTPAAPAAATPTTPAAPAANPNGITFDGSGGASAPPALNIGGGGAGAPTTPEPPPLIGGGASAANPKKSSIQARYILASDDKLLAHLRELSASAADPDDVRLTIAQLRERGYGANQLVAMVRTADEGDDWANDPFHRKNPNPSEFSADPAHPGTYVPKAPGGGTSTPAQTSLPPASTTPATFPAPTGGAVAPQTPASPSSGGGSAGGGAGNGNVPPRPQGGSTESALGGNGDLPGGSGGATQKDKKPGEEDTSAGGGGGTGGIGGDFMQQMQSFAPMIGDIAGGIGGMLGGGGGGLGGLMSGGGLGDLGGMVSGLAGGLGGILGAALPKNDDDDTPLLGEQAITVGDVPTSFAGSGPDHQHWMSSSEDYVNAHEKDNIHPIDDFEGDILKFSGSGQFQAALRQAYYWSGDNPSFDEDEAEAGARDYDRNKGKQRPVQHIDPPGEDYRPPSFEQDRARLRNRQANAFDNYADWGYSDTGSADANDWGSVDSFFDDVEDRQGYVGDTEPARKTIEDHLQYTKKSAGIGADFLAAANSGYFGVGSQPMLPTTDGLSHSNGAANLKAVVKPKKVKPPRQPKLPAPVQSVQPQQSQQQQVPQFATPPPAAGGGVGEALAQPRVSMLAGPGQVAPAVHGERPGGIQRQATQLGAGSLAPVFADAGFTPAPQPTYGAYEPAAPAQVVDYNPYRQAATGPTRTSPWDDDPGYFPGQRTAAPLTMAARVVEHDQNHAMAMGEYREPSLSAYGRTDDASEVVRQFQAANGGDWATGYQATGAGGFDISAGANRFLSRTAGRVFSQADQMRLEQEAHPQGARNLDELDLTGTHYLGG